VAAGAQLRPNVVFLGLSAYGSHGGIQRFNRRVIAGLDQVCDSAIKILLNDNNHQVAGETQSQIHGCAGNRPEFLRTAVRAGLSADKILLGHINLLPLGLLLKALRPRLKIILFAHGIEVWGDPKFRSPRIWERTAIKVAVERIAIVSKFSRDKMMEAFRLQSDLFSIFPNAVDLPSENLPRFAQGRILTVSRLAESERDKNIDKVLRALPQVMKVCPNVRLQIVGTGALEQDLRTLASGLQIEQSVDFLGGLSDVALQKAYSEANVFALPSSKEGFGIVYLEAWKAGVPVIGSTFGASSETISDGIDGFTVDPNDTDSLARRLIVLLTDDQLACRMAKSGLHKVRQRYSMQTFVANLSTLVHEC
jgi:phosphatidylinositol alpha-1,6-mannosyltransferase